MIRIGQKLVAISDQALTIMHRYRQLNNNDDEAGGILLGEKSTHSVLISKITTPNSQDKRSPFGFVRVKTPAQIIINYEHENSDGLITYLGEWHTHPQDIAVPSETDIKMIKEQFAKNIHELDCFALLILGRIVDYIALYDGTSLESFHFVRVDGDIAIYTDNK